ncbi:MAG: hypothetical protein GWO20_04240, partial [Candidatus Korarchaeota archaeon]|nr:hypothetical protein [Candidatus Korarchaeota archaeon]
YDKNMASFEDRTEMLATAIHEFGNKTFDVCTIEETMNIQGKMYDLAKVISSSFPTIEIDFFIGSDTLYKMEDWCRFDDLRKEFVFLVAERVGYPLIDIGLRQISMRTHVDYDISSTKVREEISKNGESLLVYEETLKYIKEKGLYA